MLDSNLIKPILTIARVQFEKNKKYACLALMHLPFKNSF